MEQFDRVEPVLMVRDVSRALAFYAQLGFEEVFRDDDHAPMFAMVARDAACLAMQWHDYEGVAGDRPVLRFPTQDVDALSEEFGGLSIAPRSPRPAGAHVSSTCAIRMATACSSTPTCNSTLTSMRFPQLAAQRRTGHPRSRH